MTDIEDLARARRTYVALEGIRWLPLGLVGPVFVLRPLENGVSLREVGLVFATYSIATVALELPTGGLSDVLGRRITLLLSGLLLVAFQVGFLVSGSVVTFALSAALGGFARALGSGPLEAWFVDSVSENYAKSTELRRGLSAGVASAGLGVGLGAGSLAIIALFAEVRGWDVEILSLPFLIGLGVTTVWLILIAALVRDVGRSSATAPSAVVPSWRTGVQQIAKVVSSVLRGASARSMGTILAAAASAGVGLAGIEVLYQPRIEGLLAEEVTTVAATGLLVALIGLATAGGSSISGRVTERITSNTRTGAALFQVLAAITIIGMAATQSLIAIAAAFLAFYFFSGARSPLIRELLHRVTPSEIRTANISLLSLATHVGSIAAGLLFPVVAANATIPVAWILGALVTGLGAIALLAYDDGQRLGS